MERKTQDTYQRPQAAELARRLAEPRRHLQVVTGARQVGKTTLVQQVTEQLQRPVRFVSADEPTLRDGAWLRQQWEAARLQQRRRGQVLTCRSRPAVPDSGTQGSKKSPTSHGRPRTTSPGRCAVLSCRLGPDPTPASTVCARV